MAKKALLVGINDYKQVKDLRGCVNDVTNMRSVLRTYRGFTNDEIRVLVDGRATKENILYRLKWLVDGAAPGDTLVFHFSGHGSQIRDRDKDELRDHLDELICPYDMNWDDGYITDDKLREIFDTLPKKAVAEVFLDCCHSGTGLRDLGLERPAELGLEHPAVDRFLPPPEDILCRLEGEQRELKPTWRFMPTDNRPSSNILWAGCEDFQTSADAYIHGSYNGAFTFYVCKHIRDAGGNVSRSELIRRTRDSLVHNRYSQTPQLECDNKHRKGPVLARNNDG